MQMEYPNHSGKQMLGKQLHGALVCATVCIFAAEFLRFRQYYAHHLHYAQVRVDKAQYMQEVFCSRSDNVVNAGEFANCDNVHETIRMTWPVVEAATNATRQMIDEAQASLKESLYEIVWRCGFLGASTMGAILLAWWGIGAGTVSYERRGREKRTKAEYSEAAWERMHTTLPMIGYQDRTKQHFQGPHSPQVQ